MTTVEQKEELLGKIFQILKTDNPQRDLTVWEAVLGKKLQKMFLEDYHQSAPIANDTTSSDEITVAQLDEADEFVLEYTRIKNSYDNDILQRVEKLKTCVKDMRSRLSAPSSEKFKTLETFLDHTRDYDEKVKPESHEPLTDNTKCPICGDDHTSNIVLD